ncbi:hypothetical protein RHOSPDRAFT_27849 [Rhodotorula sp. JG-1b]|nr:hypothetical protein RHOSPDRAFT_27849 [Rhodotorula sp. JG-1b]
MRPAPGLVASLREVISRTAATTSRGGASKLVRPAVKVHPPAAPHLAPGAARHASSTAPPAAWRAAVEAIYAGTFRAIRSGVKVHPGPYSGSRAAPRPSATSPFSTFSQASARRAPRTHFGHRPRPVAVSGPNHVGLGSARQFSSSGYAVFDNVVANAPLALRALADEGLDQRKWKRVKRDVAKKDRAALKGKGKAIDSRLLAAEKRADFERFFGVASARSVAAPDASPLAASSSTLEESLLAQPVTLVLAIDPDFDLSFAAAAHGSVGCGVSQADPSRQRVLSPHLLASFETITHAYSTHAHRLQAIINRLSAAGLLDPEIEATTHVDAISMSDGIDFEHVGRRVWKIAFHDRLITRSRVEHVVRGTEPSLDISADETVPPWARKVRSWTGRNSVTVGEGDWWWLVGGESSEAASMEEPLCSLPTPSSSSSITAADSDSACADDVVARLVADTFVLPDPPAFAPDQAFADRYGVASYAPSIGSTGSNDQEQDLWCGVDSRCRSPAASDISAAGGEVLATLDPAASVWAGVEESSSDATYSLFSAEEERSGLEHFLEEVEDLQRRALRVQL